MKLCSLLLVVALAACASGPEYCIVQDEHGAKFLFKGSREQQLIFERNRMPAADLERRDWTQPAIVPAWKR